MKEDIDQLKEDNQQLIENMKLLVKEEPITIRYYIPTVTYTNFTGMGNIYTNILNYRYEHN